LLSSLDDERGGEISYNLKRLYHYMQVQLLAAHARQSAGPILEVSALLGTLLEGWRVAAATPVPAPERVHPVSQRTLKVQAAAHPSENLPFCGGYMDDSAAFACSAYSF
jgi:Flagellar protein FliS